jgi:ABC-2 type transport system ATP-binding protein
MSVLSKIPEPVRETAKSLAPDAWVVAARRAVLRRYDPSIVVARESVAKRWFKRRILRLYYLPSLVSRESALKRWFSTRVLGQRPRLYHFEIHITDHCNLNCKGCGHFSNLCPPTFLDLEEFESDMAAVAQRLDVDDIWLLGGEPLLHPDLAKFVRAARVHFPDSVIKVMTNGTLVMKMGEEFWDSLAETRTVLLCDLYPVGLPVDEINARGAEHGVSIEWTEPRGEFFKIPIDIEGHQDPEDSFRRCGGLCNCPVLRHGRLYPCPFAAYADVFAEYFGIAGLDVTDADSMSVHDDRDPREIMDFMLKPIPWCRHCDFDSFEMFPWGRSRRQLDEWINVPEPGGPAPALEAECARGAEDCER